MPKLILHFDLFSIKRFLDSPDTNTYYYVSTVFSIVVDRLFVLERNSITHSSYASSLLAFNQ